MRSIRTFAAAILLGCLSTSILAQSQPSLSTIIQSDGTVKALYESQPVVTAQLWEFAENWNRVTSWQTMGNGTTTFARDGQLWPGILSTSTSFANSGGNTTLTFKAKPSRNLGSNSDHINLMFDGSFWAGSTMSDGSGSVVWNANLSTSFQTKSGNTSTLTITRPDGFKATISAPTSVRYVNQDSRMSGYGFEIRFDERNGNWSSGVERTYKVTVKFSTPTATTPDAPIVVNEGTDWVQLPQSMSVLTGSALDWSNPWPAAAGSKGWLGVNGSGKFVFQNAPNTPVRFYGANLAHYACFPTHSEAVQLADNLARMGYNTVRLHHIDYILTDPTTANSTTIDPDRLDKINYLIAQLKQRGMYVSIDLNSLRSPRPNEVISGGIGVQDYRALLLVSNAARANWLTYSSNLLNSNNPYTGLKWKDDPAIAWICLVNENTPLWMTGVRSDIKSMLDTAVGGFWNPGGDQGSRDAVNLGKQTADWMATQMRGIGVKALMTNMNAGFERALSIGRQNLDYVDNHMYFAHPSSGFGLPVVQNSLSPLRKIEENGWFAASRIKGKPFTVTEFDAVAPNQFRAEFGVMAGAMGVVQQWDGMWRFQWADNMGRALQVQQMGLFSLTGDPLNMATERAIVAMFLRGDLTNGDQAYSISNPLTTANANVIREASIVLQSILCKPMAQVLSTVSMTNDNCTFDGNSVTPDGAVATNYNNQTMKVKTTCSNSVIGSMGQTVTTGMLQAKFTKSRATVYLTSVDRKPLPQSRRMLLAHLTDVQNTGATFSGQERDTLTDWGHLPHLAKDGSAEISISVTDPTIMRVYRLDLQGRRTSQVSITKGAGKISFTATVRDPLTNLATIYYEIVSVK